MADFCTSPLLVGGQLRQDVQKPRHMDDAGPSGSASVGTRLLVNISLVRDNLGELGQPRGADGLTAACRW